MKVIGIAFLVFAIILVATIFWSLVSVAKMEVDDDEWWL